MNREIKFRGKTIKSKGDPRPAGEWATGYYAVHHIAKRDERFVVIGFEECHNIYNDEPGQRGKGGFWRPIDPDTLGQYVGEKDIHGNEIYEGDILRMNFCGNIRICEAVWTNSHKRFALIGGSYIYGFYEVLNLEVIGNIYDNPELKEEGE